jgi:hypothetical protein
MPNRTPAEKAADELAAQARAEARSGGTDAPPTDAMKQTMADRKAEIEAERARTTRSSMGDSMLQFGLGMMKNSKPIEKKAKGGKVSSASSRADGCAVKGKTRGKMV